MKHLYFILSLLCTGFGCNHVMKNQDSNINTNNNAISIDIYYVDFNIETPFAIDCSTFENTFLGKLKHIQLSDSKIQSNLIERLKNLQLINNYEDYGNYQVDTRVKIIINENMYRKEYCIDNNIVSYNDTIYYFDEKLRNVILSQIINDKK